MHDGKKLKKIKHCSCIMRTPRTCKMVLIITRKHLKRHNKASNTKSTFNNINNVITQVHDGVMD
jgi:hypothetical protein